MVQWIWERLIAILFLFLFLGALLGALMENAQWRFIIGVIVWAIGNPMLSCLLLFASIVLVSIFRDRWMQRRNRDVQSQ